MKRLLLLGLVALTVSCRPATSPPVAESTPTATHLSSPTAISPSAQPTFTPVPAPRTFIEEFDSVPPHWISFQTAGDPVGLDLQNRSGFLVFDLQRPNTWAYALYSGQDYTDVRVDALIESRASNDYALGLICRYSEKNGWYELNIFPNQTYVLLYGQWLASGVARYTPLYRGESEKIHVSGEADEMGLLCQGNTLTPFINGAQLRRWEERQYGLQDGKIGISASSFENLPVVAAYDWVKVSEP